MYKIIIFTEIKPTWQRITATTKKEQTPPAEQEDLQLKKMKISDLVHDAKNANKGTDNGKAMIKKSIESNGLGRSILIDKNNQIIAGNKTTSNAEEQGYDDVVVVETTGNTLVAVKRMDIDLDTPEGRELALADNRTSEMNLNWDKDILKNVFSPEVLEKYSMSLEKKKVEVNTQRYPIVPKFDESYHAIIIIAKSETQLSFLKTALSLETEKSYKNDSTGTGYVIDAENFKNKWEAK